MSATIRDTNNIPDLISRLKRMKDKEIQVGVFQGKKHGNGEIDLAHLATIHEFGVDIEVTPKMRAFLHYNGLHLRKDTTHIRIPERSFIRTGWDENENDIVERIEDTLSRVLELNIDGKAFLDAIGLEIEGKLKKRLVELSHPPNSPFTIKRKGSSNPLVDSGALLDSITYRVK